jgi:hypothetical protein
MKCLICNGPAHFSFAKKFGIEGLDSAEYWRCDGCGFTLSKTHAEMAPATWERINLESHSTYQGTDSDPGDPRWLPRLESQAGVLSDAADIGLLNRSGRWLDYACGDGKLTAMLDSQYGLELLKYDRYMPRGEGHLDEAALVPGGFDLVITTSVFEHLTRREHFDAINSLVSEQGVLGIHTLVCESVPVDPAWFYLVTVHCAFHTNRSMQRLFEQWGYTCSVYVVAAQLWLWFKADPAQIEARVLVANTRQEGKPIYIFKRGFVDYWKASPMLRAVQRS